MKPRRVRFTATAQEHVRREHTWWLENRDRSELFVTELEEALQVLRLLPGAGAPYTTASVTGLRRIYLRKVGCHVYYTFNKQEVIVRALWGAMRGRRPSFEP